MNPRDAGTLPVASAAEFDALRADRAAMPAMPRVVTRDARFAVQAPGGPISILLCGEETGATPSRRSAMHGSIAMSTSSTATGRWSSAAKRILWPPARHWSPRAARPCGGSTSAAGPGRLPVLTFPG